MKTTLFSISAAFLFCSLTQAQVSAYSFTQFPGSYGTSAAGTVVGLPLQDDDVNTVTLPFAFVFNGQSYTSADVSSNGCISFATLTGSEYTPVSDLGTSNVISAFGQDIVMGNAATGNITAGSPSITGLSSVTGFSVGDVLLDMNNDFTSNPTIINIIGLTIVVNQNALNTVQLFDAINSSGAIIQSVSGATPNRICQFEFKKFARFPIYDETINFKIRLYETSNRIEIVYGGFISGQDNTPAEVGLKGNSNSDFKSRKVASSTTWANSTAATFITDVCNFDVTKAPLSGQVYQWTPPTCTTPVVLVSSSSNTICSGTSAILNATGATTYSWVNGPAAAQNTVSPLATSVYTLIGANFTCTSSATFTQVVAASPALSVSAAQATICAGATTTLTASGATTYSWNGVQGTANNIVAPSSTTTYTVVGSNGTCASTKTITQTATNCTGIDVSTGSKPLYAVYPIPFTNQLTIDNTSGADFEITILDALGKVVYSASLLSSDSAKISTDTLPRGIYIVTLKGAMISETKRLVKN